MSRRKNRSENSWSFHFNDWMDNGTFHQYEDDEPEAEAGDGIAPVNPEPYARKPGTTNGTGRMDQFNDEFDMVYDHHHPDPEENSPRSDNGEAPGKSVDEYRDEDPYKTGRRNTGQ